MSIIIIITITTLEIGRLLWLTIEPTVAMAIEFRREIIVTEPITHRHALQLVTMPQLDLRLVTMH